MGERRRLTREDWVAAARDLCAAEGFDRVAVEPLATRVGATKGSFYWHFENRDALLQAVLQAWESAHTATVITTLDDGPRQERLERLIRTSFGQGTVDRLETAILAAADHPLVAPVVARVHTARIAYLDELFRARGLPPERAAARARIAYAAYLGNRHLLQHVEAGAPDDAARARLADEVVAVATAD